MLSKAGDRNIVAVVVVVGSIVYYLSEQLKRAATQRIYGISFVLILSFFILCENLAFFPICSVSFADNVCRVQLKSMQCQ